MACGNLTPFRWPSTWDDPARLRLFTGGPINCLLFDSISAAGARWIVTLDDTLVQGLPAGNAEALKKWRAILAAVSLFEKRREWSAGEPCGPVGVLSSFPGKDEFLGQEMLNLAARRARAGARRIRRLESPWKSAEPLEEYRLSAGWDLARIPRTQRW